jgi:hypothetical protein
MAVGIGKSLSEVERSWFAQRIPGTLGTTPLNDIKRKYYMSELGGTDVRFLGDLEVQWLRKVITAAGGTPSGNYSADLWKQAVDSAGLRVSNSTDENKQTYYRNVA